MVTARRQLGREGGESSLNPGGEAERSSATQRGGQAEGACRSPVPGTHRMCPESMRKELSHVIEGEIIPRLMMAHRSEEAVRGSAAKDVPGDPEGVSIGVPVVEEFSRMVIEHDAAAALAYVDTLRAQGTALESVFVHLLAPTAKRLGELWEEDQADFTEVTVGLCRLQHVLRELGGAFEGEVDPHRVSGKRILMSPIPGEQHTFGLMMISEFFRREGWDVTCDPSLSMRDLNHLVRQEWFDIVALSVSCQTLLDKVTTTVRGVRRVSRNASVGIIVGGRLFTENPQLVSVVGADDTAQDGASAVRKAEAMLARRTGCFTRDMGPI